MAMSDPRHRFNSIQSRFTLNADPSLETITFVARIVSSILFTVPRPGQLPEGAFQAIP